MENVNVFLHSVSNILRSNYQSNEYRKIIIPFLLFRRFDQFYKMSHFEYLLTKENNIKEELLNKLSEYNSSVENIFYHLEFKYHIEKLDSKKILFPIVKKFSSIDIHPDHFDSNQMGNIYEAISAMFDKSEKDFGAHFTPKEVVKLMCELVMMDDHKSMVQKQKEDLIQRIFNCVKS